MPAWIFKGINHWTIFRCTLKFSFRVLLRERVPACQFSLRACLCYLCTKEHNSRMEACCGDARILPLVHELQFSSRTWLVSPFFECPWRVAASFPVIFVLPSFVLLWGGSSHHFLSGTAVFFYSCRQHFPLSTLASQPDIPTLYKYAGSGAISCPFLFMGRVANLIQMVPFSKVCFWNLFARQDLLEHMPDRLVSDLLSGLLVIFALSKLCCFQCLESVGFDLFVCHHSTGSV